MPYPAARTEMSSIGNALLRREALGVLVVLADVDRRQLPDRREVQRLVERALVRRAVAEERDRDLIGAELLRGERRAGRDRDAAADDAVRAEVALRGVGDVHRAAAASAVAGLAAEQLREHPAEVGALRDAVAVAAVGRGDPVVVAQVRADAGGDGLFAGVAVDRSPDLVLAEERRAPLLEAADRPHDAVQIERGGLVHHFSCGHSITRIAPSRRSVNVAHASAKRVSGN